MRWGETGVDEVGGDSGKRPCKEDRRIMRMTR